MSNDIDPIPDGYSTVTPSLTLDNCEKAIEFYRKAFGAEEVSRVPGPGGSIWHAELRIGDSLIMVNSAYPQQGAHGPDHYGGSPMSIWLYVPDVEELFNQAVEAGAETIMAPEDMFWGDIMAQVRDPFGYIWSIASRVEELSEEQMKKRQEEAMSQWNNSE